MLVGSSVVVASSRLRASSVVTPCALPPPASSSSFSIPNDDDDDDDDDAPPPRGYPSLSLVRAPVLAVFNSPLLPTATGSVRLSEPRCLAALAAALQKSSSSSSPASFVHLLSPARAPQGLLSESHGLPRVGSLAAITAVERPANDDGSVVVRFEGVRRVEVLALEDAEALPSSSSPALGGSIGHEVASCVFLDDEPTVAAAAGIPPSMPLAAPPLPPSPAPSRSGDGGGGGGFGRMTISIDNPRAAALERELSVALSAVASLAAKRARASGSPEPRLPAAVALLGPPPVSSAAAAAPSKRPTTAVAQGLRAGGFLAAASAVDAWKRQSSKGGGGKSEGGNGTSGGGGDRSPPPPPGAFPAPMRTPSSANAAAPSNPYASALVAGPSAGEGPLHRRRELFSFAAASALDLDVPVAAALLLSTSTEARLEFVLSAVREHLGELTAREALRGVEGLEDAVPPEEEEEGK